MLSIELLILFLLIVLSAFFSGVETAFTNITPAKVQQMVDERKPKARSLQKLLQNLPAAITVILVGNNIVNIGASALATAASYKYLSAFAHFTLAASTSVAAGTMMLLILIFGEVIPKNVAIYNKEKFALFAAPIIMFFSIIFAPLVKFLNWFTRLYFRITGGKTSKKRVLITEGEILGMISLGEKQGIIEHDEKQMIKQIIEFGDLRVKDIMIPKSEIVAVEVKQTLDEVMKIIREKGHSRIPVYTEKFDNMIGILHAKDILIWISDTKKTTQFKDLSSVTRKVQFVSENKDVGDLFQQMKVFKNHCALVIDKHKSVKGMITLEDILEEIVGEIQDEYDDEHDQSIVSAGPNSVLVKATASIEEINQVLNVNIPVKEGHKSIASFFIDQFGSIPKKGDSIRYDNVICKIEEARGYKLLKLKVSKI